MMGENATQTILVVGGGITGMTAAIEAAEAGFEVVLVEKSPYLGGRVAQRGAAREQRGELALAVGETVHPYQHRRIEIDPGYSRKYGVTPYESTGKTGMPSGSAASTATFSGRMQSTVSRR